MKKYSVFIEESRDLGMDPTNIGYIKPEDLKKYVKIADKFLHDAAKLIIAFMIENPDYEQLLSGNKNFGKNDSNVQNCLEVFFKKGKPKDDDYIEIYNALIILKRKHRLMEIPLFQTREQFNKILTDTMSPDMVILDLESPEGRNYIVKKYENLVNKLVAQYRHVSNLTDKELESAAYVGLVNAMNSYGRYDDTEDIERVLKIKSYTFAQYAAQMIRNSILSDIMNLSKTVREPISAQSRERKEKGYNAKTNTTSGDRKIGDEDDENSKSVFDLISGSSNDSYEIDQKDLDTLWSKVFKAIEEEFDEVVYEAWYAFYGLNGRTQVDNKDIAKELGCSKSNITYYCAKVNNFLKSDPKVSRWMKEIQSLMQEAYVDNTIMKLDTSNIEIDEDMN